MKQIELYANMEAYLDSFRRQDHYVPNVSQVGDIGEEVYLYDRVILTSESNPALFAIATGAGWNVSSETAVTKYEFRAMDLADLIKGISGNTALTTFDEFKYFGGITEIPRLLFAGVTSLQRVTIPASVRAIERGAFDDLPSGAEIIYAGDVNAIEFVDDLPKLRAYYTGLTSSSRIFSEGTTTVVDSAIFAFVSGASNNQVIKSDELGNTVGSNSSIVVENTLYIEYYLNASLPWSNTFMGCNKLFNVQILGEITELQEYSFSGCSQLSSVEISSGVTGIGAYCFSDCIALRNITIPDSVKTIGNGGFLGCSSLSGVVIGSGVTTISSYAFSACSNLANIESRAVTAPSIQSDTFLGVKTNGTLVYPQGSDYSSWLSVNQYYLGYYEWNNIIRRLVVEYAPKEGGLTYLYNSYYPSRSSSVANGIQEIELASGEKLTDKPSAYVFDDEDEKKAYFVLKTANTLPLSALSESDAINVKIPIPVNSIRNYAFESSSKLTSVTIPDTVTSIGYGAFYWCSALSSITIPNSVTSIGGRCFCGCKALTDITIPDSVASLGGSAFSGCSNLESVTIGSGLTVMGDSCFYYDKKLTSAVIEALELEELKGFGYCSSLQNVTISSGVGKIGSFCFIDCTSLSSITIPNSVTSIGDGCFSGCKALTGITIPDSVTSIGDSCFSGCTSLTSITIPDSVTGIGNSCFYNCRNLISVSLNNQISTISGSCFNNCMLLSSITIPDSVEAIENYAFMNCSSLTSITIPSSVTSIGSSAFSGMVIFEENFVNNSSLDAAANNYWGAKVYKQSDNVTEVGGLFISGTTVLGARKNITSAVIPNNITNLAVSAFTDCHKLTGVTMADSVTAIGRYCFYNCVDLKDVNFGNGLKTIDGSGFSYCTSLTSVTIPNSVTQIGRAAFYSCRLLKSAVIGSSCTGTFNETFEYCPNLESVTLLGRTVPSITTSVSGGQYHLFQGCKKYGTLYYVSGSNFSTSTWNKCYYTLPRYLGWSCIEITP